MRNFQTFSRDLPRSKTAAQVTVLRSGMLSLNKTAHLALGCAEAVELLYEAEHRVIGLRPVALRARTAYIVRHPSRGANGPFMITALAFTKYYDIDTTQSLRWDAFLESDVLCICLDDPCTPVTSNRASATTEIVSLHPPEAVPRRHPA